jgi:DNA-binding beta-propeller fold protein YncE
VSRIDPATNEVVADAVALTSWPSAVAAGPDAVWVASEVDDVVIGLDPTSNRVMRQTPSCDGPVDLAVAGAEVVVACGGDRAVWRLSADGGERIVTDFPGVSAGVVVDDDRAWVTVRES